MDGYPQANRNISKEVFEPGRRLKQIIWQGLFYNSEMQKYPWHILDELVSYISVASIVKVELFPLRFQLEVHSGQWFENVLNTDRFANHQTFQKLGKAVDHDQ